MLELSKIGPATQGVAAVPCRIEPPDQGKAIAIPYLGGLHHGGKRCA